MRHLRECTQGLIGVVIPRSLETPRRPPYDLHIAAYTEPRWPLVVAALAGCLALVLDVSGWFTIAGGIFALLGLLTALVTRSSARRLRRVALWLNGFAFLLAAALIVLFFWA